MTTKDPNETYRRVVQKQVEKAAKAAEKVLSRGGTKQEAAEKANRALRREG